MVSSCITVWAMLWQVVAPVNLKNSDAFHITIEDYLLALTSTIEELSRLAPNSVTLGDYARPLQISRFIKDVHAGFQLLNLKNDALRRRSDGIKYAVKKVEDVVYDLSLRGLIPKEDQTEWKHTHRKGRVCPYWPVMQDSRRTPAWSVDPVISVKWYGKRWWTSIRICMTIQYALRYCHGAFRRGGASRNDLFESCCLLTQLIPSWMSTSKGRGLKARSILDHNCWPLVHSSTLAASIAFVLRRERHFLNIFLTKKGMRVTRRGCSDICHCQINNIGGRSTTACTW